MMPPNEKTIKLGLLSKVIRRLEIFTGIQIQNFIYFIIIVVFLALIYTLMKKFEWNKFWHSLVGIVISIICFIPLGLITLDIFPNITHTAGTMISYIVIIQLGVMGFLVGNVLYIGLAIYSTNSKKDTSINYENNLTIS